MPKPPRAACGDESLYVCERCGKCYLHCKCSPAGTLVSINSRAAAEAIRTAYRAQRQEPVEKTP